MLIWPAGPRGLPVSGARWKHILPRGTTLHCLKAPLFGAAQHAASFLRASGTIWRWPLKPWRSTTETGIEWIQKGVLARVLALSLKIALLVMKLCLLQSSIGLFRAVISSMRYAPTQMHCAHSASVGWSPSAPCSPADWRCFYPASVRVVFR